MKPFTIHGDLYYELHVILPNEASGQVHVLRVPQHTTTGQPQPGDRLDVSFLMGQVTGAKRVEGERLG